MPQAPDPFLATFAIVETLSLNVRLYSWRLYSSTERPTGTQRTARLALS